MNIIGPYLKKVIADALEFSPFAFDDSKSFAKAVDTIYEPLIDTIYEDLKSRRLDSRLNPKPEIYERASVTAEMISGMIGEKVKELVISTLKDAVPVAFQPIVDSLGPVIDEMIGQLPDALDGLLGSVL